MTLAWERHAGQVAVRNAIVIAILVLAVMNGFFLLTFHRRNTSLSLPTSRAFIFAATGLALVSVIASAMAVNHISAQDDELRLAMSDTPLEKIQPERVRLVVELIRRRAANSKENDQILAEARKNPISPPLYSPASFANIEMVLSTVAKVKKYANADLDYSARQQQAMADFRAKMANTDAEYLKSWDSAEEEQEAIEAKTIQTERQWLASILSLYDLAARHIKSIKLHQDYVEFTEPGVGSEFENQEQISKGLQNKLMNLENELTVRQTEARKRVGF